MDYMFSFENGPDIETVSVHLNFSEILLTYGVMMPLTNILDNDHALVYCS
jgi:hypothetical protein